MKLLSVLLLFSFATQAQESLPVLTPEIVQKKGAEYQIGDRIQLSVQVPASLQQDFASVTFKPKDENTSLDKAGWFIDPNSQLINGNLRFIASPIQGGKLVLPDLLVMKDESHPLAQVSSISVNVAQLNVDPNKAPELLDVIVIPLPTKYLLLGLGIMAGVIALLLFLYRKYKNKIIAPSPKAEIKLPPTPDHVIALRDLDTLYENYPFTLENLKPVAFGVSQILKNYFSVRFKVDASESTTDEMLALLRKQSISDADLRSIKSLFQNLDLIKFTKLQHHEHFSKADYQEFRDQARMFIEKWMQREVNSP